MKTEAHVKGISFLNRYAFVQERFGEAGLAKLRASAPAHVQQVLDASSASTWYPLRTLVDLDLLIVQAFFQGDLRGAQQLGFFNLDRALKSVYRVVLRLFDISTLLKKGNSVWSKMVDQGRVEVSMEGPTVGLVRLVGLDTLHPVYCNVLAGSLAGAVAACGGKNPVADHVACLHTGAAACEFRVRWE